MGIFSAIAGSIAGPLVGGLIGKSGEDKARENFNTDISAAIQQANQIRTNPLATNTLFGSTGADLSFQGSEEFDRLRQQTQQARSIAFDDLRDFNRNDFANRFFDSIDKVASKREGRALQSLESTLFNKSGINTGTADQISRFQSDITDARQRRLMEANIASDNRQRGLFDQFMASLNPEFAFQNAQIDQLRTGISGGQLNAQGDAATRQAIINAGAQGATMGAQSTTDFFNSLGGVAGGAVQAGIDSFFAPQPSFSPFTPNNPFNGSGPLSSFRN